ncbi:MAG: hypothetical protein ACXAAR_06295 [Candidatus Thorarchaeota archaeon]
MTSEVETSDIETVEVVVHRNPISKKLKKVRLNRCNLIMTISKAISKNLCVFIIIHIILQLV